MLNGNQAVAFEWSFAGLALIFVLLRLYVKVFYGPSSKLHWSDWVVVIAWLNFAACCTCDVELNRLGFIHPNSTYSGNLSRVNPDPEKTVRILKIIYFSFFPYLIDLWLIKAGILSFYYAVIPRSVPLHRWFLHITAGVCVATFVLALFSNIFWCYPIWRNWSLDGGEICIASAKEPPFFLTVCSTLITDLLIFCLPFPLLQSLHLTRRKMLGVVVLFVLGSLTILAAICRLAVIARAAIVTEVTAWTAVECSTGIMVACAPALRVLLIRRERNPSSSGLSKSTRPYPRPGPPILSASDRNEIWDGTDATAPHWIRMASIPGSTAVSPREQQFDDAVIEALSKQLTPNRNSRDFRDCSFSNFDMVAQIPNMRLQLGRGIVEHAPMSPHTRSSVDDHMTIGSISPRTLSPLTSPDFVRLDHRPGSEDVPLNRWDTGESGRLELGRIVETAAGANRPRSISRTSGNSHKSGLRGFL